VLGQCRRDDKGKVIVDYCGLIACPLTDGAFNIGLGFYDGRMLHPPRSHRVDKCVGCILWY
jgi:hypothetical protein